MASFEEGQKFARGMQLERLKADVFEAQAEWELGDETDSDYENKRLRVARRILDLYERHLAGASERVS